MMATSINNSRPLLHDSSDSGNEEYPEEIDDKPDNFEENLTKQLLSTHNAPNDKYNFNYIVFYLLGMTTLLPWNFFVTPEDIIAIFIAVYLIYSEFQYWMYKLRNVTETNTTVLTGLTPMQAQFTSNLNISSAIPGTTFLIINAFIGHRISLKIRMLTSLVTIFFFFILTTGLVEVNTDQWQEGFLSLTMLSVAIMNVGSAFLSGGLFGISGLFPSEYMTAAVSGQALGGIFSALTEIISLSFGTSPMVSAFVYFNIGNIVLLVSIICYILMSNTIYFKYHTIDKLAMTEKSGDQVALIPTTTSLKPQFSVVLKKIWLYGFAQWFVYVVTVSVFPSITVLVTSQNYGHGNKWDDVFFLPVVNYLFFNSADYFGRVLAGIFEWPCKRPGLVAIFSILRIVGIPLLLVCNANPRQHIPVLIHSDYIYIAIMIIFGLTNGYLTNISMIGAPKSVQNHEKEMASSMMAAFLGLGLVVGAAVALVFVHVI